MAEAIHCPSCTTRYRLHPERLKPVIRRAKCFACGSVFPVGDVVRRLLALPAESTPPGSAPIPVVAVEAIAHEDLAPDTTPAPPLTLSDLESTDPGLLERTLVAVPGSLPEAKVEVARSYPLRSRTPPFRAIPPPGMPSTSYLEPTLGPTWP